MNVQHASECILHHRFEHTADVMDMTMRMVNGCCALVLGIDDGGGRGVAWLLKCQSVIYHGFHCNFNGRFFVS